MKYVKSVMAIHVNTSNSRYFENIQQHYKVKEIYEDSIVIMTCLQLTEAWIKKNFKEIVIYTESDLES